MSSEMLSSASSRSSGPWPSASSAIADASRSLSSREKPCSSDRWRLMSTRTRSRSAIGSMLTLNNCGPRSPITAMWTRFLDVARDPNVRTPADDCEHVLVVDPDPTVRAIEHKDDPIGVVAHQLERLEPKTRVLERERVERSDHAHIGRVIDRRYDFGRETG